MSHAEEVALWRAALALGATLDRLPGKAGADDHFYGAWEGGSAASGGHPAKEGTHSGATAEEESAAVHSWQSAFEDCRYIQTHPDSAKAKAFASAVDHSPRVEGLVYRGVSEHGGGRELTGAEAKALWSQRVGDDVRMDNLVSTSPDLRTAMRYGNVLFEIRGGEAHDISGLSHFPKFQEAVLKPGAFRVLGVRDGPPITETNFGPISPRPSIIVTLHSTGGSS